MSSARKECFKIGDELKLQDRGDLNVSSLVYLPLRYTSDGSTKAYPVNFSTLEPEHLRVVVDGVLVHNYDVSEGQVVFHEAPPEGQLIIIFRVSPQERIVDFTNTSMLNAEVLDTDSNQLLYMIQEALANAGEALRISWSDAGAFDARGLRITNLGDPKLPSDAVNKEYTDGVLTQAKEHADRAEAAKDEALDALERAKDARDDAERYADEAKASAENAEESANEVNRMVGVLEDLIEWVEDGDLSRVLLDTDIGTRVASQQDLLDLINEVDSLEANLGEDISTLLDSKVDKVPGKGLSTEDFTTALKNKLEGIESGAQKNTVHSVAGKTGAVTLNKGDVGLGSVQNYPIATQAQAEAGTSNSAYMTPLRVAQAIAKLSGDAPKVAVGVYTGSGEGTKVIETGFRPKFVFILTRYKAERDSPVVFYIPGRTALMIIKNGGHRDLDSSYITAVDNGFRVGGTKTPGLLVTGAFMSLNAKRVYHYLAIG